MKRIQFDLSHLDRFSIVKKPCTAIVKCKTHVKEKNLYTGDGHNRWLVDLYAITEPNLKLLKNIYKKDLKMTYETASQYFLKGAIWENTVYDIADLPIKKENVVAVFDYVNTKLMCTQISLLPKVNLSIYNPAKDLLEGIEELVKMVKEINDEK